MVSTRIMASTLDFYVAHLMGRTGYAKTLGAVILRIPVVPFKVEKVG